MTPMGDGSSYGPIDYLIVGHVTRDLTPEGEVLGGTAAYAGLTAQALGARVGVFTSTGLDLDLSPLEGLELACLPSASTTTFRNRYAVGGRRQYLLGRARDLSFEAIPQGWARAGIVHLAPLAGEVPLHFVSRFPHSLVCATPQGWLRRQDEAGEVHSSDWRKLKTVLSGVSAAVFSIEDIEGDEEGVEGLSRCCPVLVVTEGALGARVFVRGEGRRVPAPAVEEVEPTGAGDIFAACFFWHWARTRDAWRAAAIANRIAATSVTRVGLAGVPNRVEAQLALEIAG